MGSSDCHPGVETGYRDIHMGAKQWLGELQCPVWITGHQPGIVSLGLFHRGDHPGWSTYQCGDCPGETRPSRS